MKFVCSRCGNLVDEEDVIIDIKDVNGFRLAIEAYCPSCWKRTKDSRDEYIKESLKKVSEGGFWRGLIK